MIGLRKGVIAVIFATLLQFFLLNGRGFPCSAFPFLDGVPTTAGEAQKVIYVIAWYLPVLIMSSYYTGWFDDYLNQYGIYTLTRDYKRERFYAKHYRKLLATLFIFVVSQFGISAVMNIFVDPTLVLEIPFFKLAVMYFMTLLLFFSFQTILEFYINPQVSYLVTNMLIVLMAYFPIREIGTIRYVLVSSYGMGYRNGFYTIQGLDTNFIQPMIALVILSVLVIVIVTIGYKKIKKLDIM